MGIWCIVDLLLKNRKRLIKNIYKYNLELIYYEGFFNNSSEKPSPISSGYISTKESIYIGLALALNSMIIGISASITGLSIFITSIFCFIFSLLAVRLGYFLGSSYLSEVFGKYGPIISGIMFIILGIYEMFI